MLAALPLAEKVPTHTVMLDIPYPLLEQIRLLIAAHRGELESEQFAADVTATVRFTVAGLPAFQSALGEISHGQLEAVIIETNPATIMPLKRPG